MKKSLWLIVFILSSAIGSAQSLIFCEKVSVDGKPEKPSHIFRIGKEGGFFQFLAILDKPVNSSEVRVDIFRVDETGKEAFDATITVSVQKEWIWFSKEVNFFRGGDYTVYAYTAEDRLLCTGMVKVIQQ